MERKMDANGKFTSPTAMVRTDSISTEDGLIGVDPHVLPPPMLEPHNPILPMVVTSELVEDMVRNYTNYLKARDDIINTEIERQRDEFNRKKLNEKKENDGPGHHILPEIQPVEEAKSPMPSTSSSVKPGASKMDEKLASPNAHLNTTDMEMSIDEEPF